MTNNQVCELAHNCRTTGAPVRFKVRRFAPVRQLRQLLYNWQLERRRGTPGRKAPPETPAGTKISPPEKSRSRIEPPAARPSRACRAEPSLPS